jgi:hypothetical protein
MVIKFEHQKIKAHMDTVIYSWLITNLICEGKTVILQVDVTFWAIAGYFVGLRTKQIARREIKFLIIDHELMPDEAFRHLKSISQISLIFLS